MASNNRKRRERTILDANDQVDFAQLSEETNEIATLTLSDFNTKHDAGEALSHAVEAIHRLCRLVEILDSRSAPTRRGASKSTAMEYVDLARSELDKVLKEIVRLGDPKPSIRELGVPSNSLCATILAVARN